MSASAAESKPLPPSRPRRWKRLAARLTLAGLVFLVSLKIADVVVGRVRGTADRHWLRLLPSQTGTHKSAEFEYAYNTNRLGFRGKDLPREKLFGTKRVLITGDSFTWGVGSDDDEIFAALLGSDLQRELGGPVDVANLGLPGTSTLAQHRAYAAFRREVDPDVVILCVWLGNDLVEILDERTPEEYAAWRPAGFVRGAAFTLFPSLYLEAATLRGNAMTRRLAGPKSEAETVQLIRREAGYRGADPDAAERRYRQAPAEIRRLLLEGMFPFQRFSQACTSPDLPGNAFEPDGDHFARAWPRMERALDLFRQTAAADETPLLLVLIPAAFHISAEAAAFDRSLGFEVDEAWLATTGRTQRALAEWAERHRVPMRDLTEAFRERGHGCFWIQDGHLTPRGNRLVADELERWPSLRKALGQK